MSDLNLSSILSELSTCDSDRQVMALDQYFRLPTSSVSESQNRSVVSAAVKAMEISDNPYPVAEKVLRFGAEKIQPLIDLLARNTSSEVATLAALILVKNNYNQGVPFLVDEVKHSGVYFVIASRALASAGCADHVNYVFEKLRQHTVFLNSEFPSTDDEVALSLLNDLDTLNVQVPSDIRSKLYGL